MNVNSGWWLKRVVAVAFGVSLLGALLVHLLDPDFAGYFVVSGGGVVDTARGELLYEQYGCGACHGSGGGKPVLKDYPLIAGQQERYLYNQMVQIRDGQRANGGSSYMKEAIKGLSDADAKEIALYLSYE